MYHGTSQESAENIRKNGFKPSQDGMLCPRVYLSKDESKAWEFAKNKTKPAILVCKVKLGKVITINSSNW